MSLILVRPLTKCHVVLLTCIAAKDRGDRPEAREITDWSRKGPLPDLPGRGNDRGGDRRGPERTGGFGSDFGGERGERRERFPEGDGKVRDFGNWDRKGPLSPLPQTERGPREGGRPRTNDGPRGEGYREAPAAQWGEGRAQGSQDGSRPPRREFQERPVVERAPTAAEQDNQWRAKMRPDVPAPAPNSSGPSRDGSEAPSPPAPGNALPVGRPKLNLAKRTVSEALEQPSPTVSNSGDAKASPFGGARPIDTAAKEREIEEKKIAAAREKKEAEDKAREEKKEAAAKKAAEEAAEAAKKSEQPTEGEDASKPEETIERENANGEIVDDKSVKPREIVRDARPKPAETGAWRRASNGPPPPRDDIPRGPRGRGGRGRGEGRGEGRGGPRHVDDRGGRQNNGRAPESPVQSSTPTTEVLEDDGWSTVQKPKKNNRGGNQGSRPIAS